MTKVTILACLLSMAAAPTTQLHSVSEADALRSEVKILRAAVHRLEAENARLRAELKSPEKNTTQHSSSPSAKGISTFASRTKKRMARGAVAFNDGQPVGYKFEKKEIDDALARAKEIDQKIDEYLSSHQVQSNIETALRNGWVEIGMPKEALKLFGDLLETNRDAHGSSAKFLAWDPVPSTYEESQASIYYIEFDQSGKVVSFSNPPSHSSVSEPEKP